MLKNFSLRKALLVLADTVTLVLATVVSYFANALFLKSNEVYGADTLIYAAFVVFAGVLGMALLRAYRSMFSVEYVADFARCLIGLLAGEAVLVFMISLLGKTENLKFVVVSALVGMIAIMLQRVVYFIVIKRFRFIYNAGNLPRALIIGAGVAGRTVLGEIRRSKDHAYKIIGFVDDDESKIGRYIDNIRVYGPTILIPELCEKHEINTLIFAIPTCDDENRKKILSVCSRTGCDVQVIPSLFEISKGSKMISQIKPLNVEELLGRDVIKLNNSGLAEFINNRTILVTGVGSIGSELCRQIIKYGPKKLVMVDIYENNAYDIQQELVRKGYGDRIATEIASVRDKNKMSKIFNAYKPEVVFHAAAHKHVPLMETNPEEAVKNNIGGTFNIARLCDEFGISKMVLISTDKAVNPTNVMGATKRCCEMIMQYMTEIGSKTDFVAVRFGNVLGSNGSVIPLFVKQIESGGPVTVTHPDIIRYFMTIPEAVSLVLEAGKMANGGEIFVLDMGEPVKITTLAENIIRLYGYEPYVDMPINFIGLRPGEKLFEELLMSEEGLKSTENRKIFIGNQIEIDTEKFEKDIAYLLSEAKTNNAEKTVEVLHSVVPTFKTGVSK